jgi:succinate dehydrogenase / fumarate reductase cytochrome b subunit
VNIAVNSKRPVNLDLRTIKQPVTALTSIAHRISGIILFISIAGLLWMLDVSLSSESGFERVQSVLQNPLAKLILWGVLSALLYHLVAGIRHLIMDAGIGEGLESGKRGSQIVIVVSVILIVLLGVWIW